MSDHSVDTEKLIGIPVCEVERTIGHTLIQRNPTNIAYGPRSHVNPKSVNGEKNTNKTKNSKRTRNPPVLKARFTTTLGRFSFCS